MTRTISSETSNTKYFLTINDQTGKAVDCSCGDQQWRCHAKGDATHQCKHIRLANWEIERAEAFRQAWHALDFRSEAQRDRRATLRINTELAMGW